MHYLGPRFGREKVEFLAAADVFLLPGAVGLTILDCFAIGIPLPTTEVSTHGPEIDYLDEGVNGLITAFDLEAYSRTAIGLLEDPERLRRLKSGSAEAAGKYSLVLMVENFCVGVEPCLAHG